jgi:hypothetical protein
MTSFCQSPDASPDPDEALLVRDRGRVISLTFLHDSKLQGQRHCPVLLNLWLYVLGLTPFCPKYQLRLLFPYMQKWVSCAAFLKRDDGKVNL